MLGDQATPQMQELEGIQHDPTEDWTPNPAQERLLNQVNPWREMQQRGGWRKVLGGLAEGYFSPQAGEQAKDLAVKLYQQDREMEMRKQEDADMKKFRGVQMKQMEATAARANQESQEAAYNFKQVQGLMEKASLDEKKAVFLGINKENPRGATNADLLDRAWQARQQKNPDMSFDDFFFEVMAAKQGMLPILDILGELDRKSGSDAKEQKAGFWTSLLAAFSDRYGTELAYYLLQDAGHEFPAGMLWSAQEPHLAGGARALGRPGVTGGPQIAVPSRGE